MILPSSISPVSFIMILFFSLHYYVINYFLGIHIKLNIYLALCQCPHQSWGRSLCEEQSGKECHQLHDKASPKFYHSH